MRKKGKKKQYRKKIIEKVKKMQNKSFILSALQFKRLCWCWCWCCCSCCCCSSCCCMATRDLFFLPLWIFIFLIFYLKKLWREGKVWQQGRMTSWLKIVFMIFRNLSEGFKTPSLQVKNNQKVHNNLLMSIGLAR